MSVKIWGERTTMIDQDAKTWGGNHKSGLKTGFSKDNRKMEGKTLDPLVGSKTKKAGGGGKRDEGGGAKPQHRKRTK